MPGSISTTKVWTLGQRSTELIAYYKSHVTERAAHIEYDMSLANLKSADIPAYSIDFDKPVMQRRFRVVFHRG